MILLIVIAVVLLAHAAALSAAESAMTTLSRGDLVELAESSRSKRSLNAIAEDPPAHLVSLSLVRILSEMSAAVLLAQAIDEWIESFWVTIAVSIVVLTLVSYLLVFTSPRSLGRRYARGTLRVMAPIVHLYRIVLSPFLLGIRSLRSMRADEDRPRSITGFTSEEHLLSMVDEAADHDVIAEDDRELIHSVFDFNRVLVRETMVPRIDMVVVQRDASAGEALSLLLEQRVSRAPIVGEDVDDIVGITYVRDLARYLHVEGGDPNAPITELAAPVEFVPESLNADRLLQKMQAEHLALVMVFDEYGGVSGLVSIEDLLEELVGELSDGSDRVDSEVEPLGDGSYRVATRLGLDELGDLFDIELEDEDVDSVGGLMAKNLGRIPERGDRVIVASIELVGEREGRRRRLLTAIATPVARPDFLDEEPAEAGGEGDGAASHPHHRHHERAREDASRAHHERERS